MISNEISHKEEAQYIEVLPTEYTESYASIVKLYDYLNSLRVNFSHFPELKLSEEMLLIILSKLEAKKKSNTAAIRVALLEKTDTNNIDELEKELSLLRFVEFYSKEIKIHQDYRLVCLIYLLSTLPQLHTLQKISVANQKIAKIVSIILKQDKTGLTRFYQDNLSLFAAYRNNQGLKALLVADEDEKNTGDDYLKVKCFVQELREALQAEKNPIFLASLFHFYISEPIKYAACVIWMIERGVPPITILKSGLLQRFFMQHVSSLEVEGNEIKYLYNLLGQFSMTRELIDLAQGATANVRGLQRYALNGELQPDKQLELAEAGHLPRKGMKLTKTADNFNKLYHLFGHFFICHLLQIFPSYRVDGVYQLLREQLNSVEYQKIIPELIGYICKRSNADHQLDLLANILTNATIETLLKNREANIFYLAPYKPFIVQHIGLNEAQQIVKLTIKHKEPFDCLISLKGFLRAFEQENRDIERLVLEAITDLIIKNKLYDYGYISSLCNHRFGDLFQTIMHDILCRNRLQLYAEVKVLPIDQFTQSTYLSLEDARHEHIQQLSFLKDLGIESLNRYIIDRDLKMIDKYQFRAEIVKWYAENINNAADFEKLFTSITPAMFDISLSDHVSERLRTLLEIIGRIPQQHILELAIEMIESPPFSSNNWQLQVIDAAIESKNVCLLLKLFFMQRESTCKLTEEQVRPIIDNLVCLGLKFTLVNAIKNGHYSIVEWCCRFVGKYQLNSSLIQQMLTELCKLNFNYAAEKYLQIMNLLCERVCLEHVDYKPFFNKLIASLAETGSSQQIETLSVCMINSKKQAFIKILEKNTLEIIFIAAFKMNSLELIKNLVDFHPKLSDVSQLLAKAACLATETRIINYLYDIADVQSLILSDPKKYYELALKNNNSHIIKKIYELRDPLTSPSINEQSSHQDLLKYSCDTLKRMVKQHNRVRGFFSNNQSSECFQQTERIVDELEKNAIPLAILYLKLNEIKCLPSFKPRGPLAWVFDDIQNRITQALPQLRQETNSSVHTMLSFA